MTESDLERRTAELRRAFDASFAALPAAEAEASEDLITLRVADRPYALRARDVAGLYVDRPLLKVPTRQRGLLGIAGIRSLFVPVYDLGLLLELESEPGPLRWIVVCAESEPVGFAFQALEGFVRVAKSNVTAVAQSGEPRLSREVLRLEESSFPIVEVRSLVTRLKGAGRAAAPSKES